jgi:hypothetical protein
MERVERSYYPDGTLKEEIHYQGSKEHGLWRQWHPNGVLKSECLFENGLYVNTPMRSWHENGTLHMEMQIVNGTENGRTTFYSRNGAVQIRYFALDGQQVSKARYDEACRTRRELPRYDDEPLVSRKGGQPKKKNRKPSDHSPHRALADEEAFVNRLMEGCRAEARAWLHEATATNLRRLGPWGPDLALEYVERLYELGAKHVLAVQIEAIAGVGEESTDHLLIELPDSRQQREGLFKLEAELAEAQGLDHVSDHGQKYLYMRVDV